METITLREVVPSDLPLFYQWGREPRAVHMAAFTAADPSDREWFDAHWQRVLSAPGTTNRTILLGRVPVGSIACFPDFGDPEITYWIDPAHWGKGIATRALAAFLLKIHGRPLYARAASDNIGSMRVLERNGFSPIGTDTGFAEGRAADTEETIFVLE
jgi:RimJ/RimL family protein N-acetyltransferase